MRQKYIKVIARVLALMLGVVLILGLIAPALAAPGDGDSTGEVTEASGWTPVGELAGSFETRTRDDARDLVNSRIGEALNVNTDSPREKEVMQALVTALAAADWATYNAGAQSGSTYVSIFDVDDIGDAAEAYAEALSGIEALRSKLASGDGGGDGILPSSPNEKTGEVASSSVLSGTLTEGETLVSGSLLEYDGYYNMLLSILQNYVDANVTGILEKYYDGDVASNFKAEWCDAAINKSVFDDAMVMAIKANEDKLAKYIDVLNVAVATYLEFSSFVLQDEEPVDKDNEDAGTWKSYRFNRNDDISDNLSVWTRAIHSYLKRSDSDGVRPDTTDTNVVKEFDTSQGTLKALSNATLSGGNVVYTNTSESPNLTELGYYVLGVGVVYDPFVSYAGNPTYLSVLQEFVEDTSRKDELLSALQSAVNIKKPLYVTDASKNTWAQLDSLESVGVSSYRDAFLQDVLDDTLAVTSVFCVAKGEMTPSELDSSTFDYVRVANPSSSQVTTATNNNTDEYGVNANGDSATGTISGATVGNYSDGGLYKTPGTSELVASEAQMSRPVLIVSTPNKTRVKSLVSKIGATTKLIIDNAAQDCRDNPHIRSAATERLFVNGLGDIVLYDGTIVLPAIANPILYQYTSSDGSVDTAGDTEGAFDEETSSSTTLDISTDAEGDQSVVAQEDTSNTVIEASVSTGAYPYTAALLNHYPIARVMKDDSAQIVNPKDEGKCIMSYQGGEVEATEIKAGGNDKKLDVRDITTSNAVAFANSSFCIGEVEEDVYNLMPYIKMQQGFWRGVSSAIPGVFDKGYTQTRWIQTFAGGFAADGNDYFPLNDPEQDTLQSYIDRAGPLVTSAVRYVSDRDSSDVMTPAVTFRADSYIEDFLAQGLLGTQYAETIVKNGQLSYEDMVNDQYGRFNKFVKDIVASVLDTLGHIDGVLAIKDGYSNGFFNVIVGFIQDFYLIITILLLIMVAVKFLRGNYSIFYVLAIGVFVFAAFEVYAVWVPTAVPAAYNMVVNDVVEETVWNTVAVSAEKYDETYRKSNRKDALTGNPRAYTATITLYRMTFSEMRSVAEMVGVDYKQVKRGDIIWLDPDGGIFIQGDQIRMSIDSLLVNNTMRGLYKSQWDMIDAGATDEEVAAGDVSIIDNPYIIKLTEPYVSLESYYTPYCQIERAFISNLNKFTRVFNVPRNQYNYSQTLYKDAFMFNAFTNSGIFLSPGDEQVLAENIKSDLTISDMRFTVGQVVQLCKQLYEPEEDWLNLRSVFVNPTTAMKESLWGMMLQRQGFYEQDWSISERSAEKLSDLIAYMNDQTKKFIIRNQSQLNFMSDENAIKFVSLYATTTFTHYVSEFGYWLYPNYINACDIELSDVLYGAMTTLRDRNIAIDGDIVNTVVMNLGLVGALLVLFIALFAVVFVFVMTYLIPVLYALFGLVLVYKLLNSDQGVGLVKGYAKVTMVTVGLYIVFSFGLRLVKWGGYQWYGYVACLIVTVLCLYFLAFVIISVLSNPLEMGNDVLMRNMFGALDKLTGNRLSRLTSNHLTINSRNGYYGEQFGAHRQFMRSSPVDTRVSTRIPRRGQHYGRWEDFDDDSMSRRAQVINRFGNLTTHRSEVGTNITGFRTTAPMRGLRKMRDAVDRRVDKSSGDGRRVG